MSLIAAFHWNKSPRCAISTMVVDEETMQYMSPPKIQALPKGFLNFRRAAKAVIRDFFIEIIRLHKANKKPIILEFKIVFHVHDIPYLMPAKESSFVYKTFNAFARKAKKSIRTMKIQPQLRKKLTGKTLIQFKKELRALHLVSRKKTTGFEYHLWAIALHATPVTYKARLQQVRKILVDAMWSEEI